MKKEKLQQLGHLVAGIVTLVYGFDAFEAGDFSSAAYYLTLAIIFLVVAGMHKWIAEKFMNAEVAFNLLEAITIIYAGWKYKIKGHPFLFYLMVAAGTCYCIFAFINMFSKPERRHRSSRSRKRRRGSSKSIEESGSRDKNES